MGAVIAIYLGWNAYLIVQCAVHVLMDHELPPTTRNRIKEIVLAHPEVQSLHDLRTREAGATQFIELHVEVDGGMTVRAAHEVTDAIEAELFAAFPAAEVILHQEPAGVEDARLDHRIAATVRPARLTAPHAAVKHGAIIGAFRAARADPALAVFEGFHALKHALRFDAEIVLAVTADRAAVAELAARLAPDLERPLTAILGEVPPRSFATLPRCRRRPGYWLSPAARRRCLQGYCMPTGPPLVLLENPSDLGNIGAVVRVAAAAGAAGVLTTGRHDPWHPTALRGSAGLHFALPVARIDALPRRPIAHSWPCTRDGRPLDPAAFPAGALLAFGSERGGLGADLLDRAADRLAIPMRPGVSSLNLATAVAPWCFRLAAGQRRRMTNCRHRVFANAVLHRSATWRFRLDQSRAPSWGKPSDHRPSRRAPWTTCSPSPSIRRIPPVPPRPKLQTAKPGRRWPDACVASRDLDGTLDVAVSEFGRGAGTRLLAAPGPRPDATAMPSGRLAARSLPSRSRPRCALAIGTCSR